jgi:hypothetical protein
VRACAHCGGSVGDAFRYCPWCGTPQRRKMVRFFPAAAAVPDDEGKALRVSRYVREGHVRFSVWDDSGSAQAAVSLDEDEAAHLASFLAVPHPRPSLLSDLRARVLGR